MWFVCVLVSVSVDTIKQGKGKVYISYIVKETVH